MLDTLLSVLLVVCATADAHDQLPAASFDVPAVALCVLCAGSVAWRRLYPAWACFAACTGYGALAAITGYDSAGVFEWVPVLLTFYTLGRQAGRSKLSPVEVGLIAWWLVAAALIYYAPGGGSAGGALVLWAVAPVAVVVGRWFAARSRLIEDLNARTTALQREQTLRARDAVAEARRGMARELHDVVAHCVSVMVVQTVGARSVAPGDPKAARNALGAVGAAGQEALVELRRIVGVLRHTDAPLADVATPALARLDGLVERARAAGVPVDLRVDGAERELPAGLQLVAYRLVQEALTNVIKHSGGASAVVRLGYEERALRLEVVDSGGNAPAIGVADGTGHGLRGMRERVALYGGDLSAGPVPAGGFAVRAWIPYAGEYVPTHAAPAPNGATHADVRDDQLRWPWLDPVLAILALILFEQRALAANDVHGPLVVSATAAAGIALAAVWRRSHPVLFSAAVVTLDLALIELGPFKPGMITIYLWMWVLYTLAAWAERRIAIAGLAAIVGVFTVGQVRGTNNANIGLYIGIVLCLYASWGCASAMRSRRRMTRQLERLSEQLAQERETRAQLAVAAERSRIARELHAVVARSVTAMVVQAEAAVTLLGQDLGAADRRMETIEGTGRETLRDMRRILGVLRHPNESAELEPLPGIGQIHALIHRVRQSGQAVQVRIDGEPGFLPPGVELGLYRILEEALTTAAGGRPASPVDVSLTFGDDELELRVAADVDHWPTKTMSECVTLCAGTLAADHAPDGRRGLVARLPTALQGAFA